MHVGSGIINVTPPVNHPARVAERVAMMDHVSSGRFEFGTGRGSSTTEMGGFGITDPELTRDMYDEAIARDPASMWSDDKYSFDGEFFTMPERNVLPKPYVKPHPPMWVAAGNPSTFEKAAQMGLGVLCFTGGSPEKMAPLIELYKKTIVNAEPVGDYVNDNVAVTTSFMCLEDRDEARELMTRSGNGRQQTLVFHYLDTFPKPPFVPEWPEEIPDPTLEQIEAGFQVGREHRRHARRLRGRRCRSGSTSASTSSSWARRASVYPHELLERTVKLFGDEVIPRFDTDPEHSTSRYRREAAARLGLRLTFQSFSCPTTCRSTRTSPRRARRCGRSGAPNRKRRRVTRPRTGSTGAR